MVGENGIMRVVRARTAFLSFMLIAATVVAAVPGTTAVAAQTEVTAEAVVSSQASREWMSQETIVSMADLSRFSAGKIISDALFFDGDAMTQDQVQQFLNSKVGSCRAGYTCLKDYSDVTRAIPADAMCQAYNGGGRESSAAIIARVANACGISAKAIIVMLQKEQGLVTSTAPSAYAYRSAMGQGCPDTAACDSRYYGFFNQVYGAAWQLKRYANPPGTSQYFTWYAPGRTWAVRYNPNASCGSSPLYIQNQATANLYYYTPYQPNAAALRAGYGEGDGCSSYGNRNFFNYYSDWFGDPSIDVFGAILATWKASGGGSGPVGVPVAQESCDWTPGAQRCVQTFAGGRIAWGPQSGTYPMLGGINAKWGEAASIVGLPTGPESCSWGSSSSCTQPFQNGTVVWSARAGNTYVAGGINEVWRSSRAVVGLPIEDETCVWEGNSNCLQVFESGAIAWSRSGGTHAMGAGVYALWSSQARAQLGMPTGDESCTWDVNPNCVQLFENGAIVWSRSGGTQAMSTETYEAWSAARATIGMPVAAEVCEGTGSSQRCVQQFEAGVIARSNAGAYYLGAGISSLWQTAKTIIGFPTGSETCAWTGQANCVQEFQAGAIVWSTAGGTHYLGNGIYTLWRQGARQVVGMPTGAESCQWSGEANCVQEFQVGAIVWSRVGGMHYLGNGVYTLWRQGARNVVGLPLGDEVCAWGSANPNCVQGFQAGTIAWSSVGGTQYIAGAINTAWKSTAPPLGPPLAAEQCTWSGDVKCMQDFVAGSIVWRPASGAVVSRR